MIPLPQARFVAPLAPEEAEALAEKAPIDVATEMAAWRPESDGYPRPTARGYAGKITEFVEQDQQRWLAEDPSALVRAFRHPTYIAVYVRALGEHAAELTGSVSAIVDTVELVQGEPWEVVNLGGDEYDFDQTWTQASHEAVETLGKLAAAGADFGRDADRLWTLIAIADPP